MATYTPEQTTGWTADDWAALTGETVRVCTDNGWYGPFTADMAELSPNGVVTLWHEGRATLTFYVAGGVTVTVEP